MSIIEKAVQWAISIANDNTHGYSQSVRWGPSYDCSSLVISAYRQAGLNLNSTYTGDMRADFLAHGFKAYNTNEPLKRGDVLLNDASHTALYIGDGQLVHARSSEGTCDTVDGSGNEIRVQPYFDYPWDVVLRYEENTSDQPEPTDSYTVKAGDTLWKIAERFLGNGALYKEIMKLNNLTSTLINPGQVLKVSSVSVAAPVSISGSDELVFLESLAELIEKRINTLKETTTI